MDRNVPAVPFFFAPSEASRGAPAAQQQQAAHPPHQHHWSANGLATASTSVPHPQQQQQYTPHDALTDQGSSIAAALARLQASVGSNPLPLPLASPPVVKQEETKPYAMAAPHTPTPFTAAASPVPPSHVTMDLVAELRGEMRRMASRIQELEASTKEAVQEARQAVRRPLQSLESDVAALRDATRTRFEAIERHTNALHSSTVVLMKKLETGEQVASTGAGGSGAGTLWGVARGVTPTTSVSKEEREEAELRERQEKRRKELENEWYPKASAASTAAAKPDVKARAEETRSWGRERNDDQGSSSSLAKIDVKARETTASRDSRAWARERIVDQAPAERAKADDSLPSWGIKRNLDQVYAPSWQRPEAPSPTTLRELRKAEDSKDTDAAIQRIRALDYSRVPSGPSADRAAAAGGAATTSLRDRSPLRSAPAATRYSMEASQNSLVKRLRLSESHATPRAPLESPRGFLPAPKVDWCSSLPLQAKPLPGGEGFEVVVRAMKQVYKAKQLEPGTPLDSSVVCMQVAALEPGALQRVKAERWSQFVVLAQRYVCLVVRLSDKVRYSKGGCEQLLLRDMDLPYFATLASPPSFAQQRDTALNVQSSYSDELELPSSSAGSTSWTREPSSSQPTLSLSQQTLPSSTSSQATSLEAATSKLSSSLPPVTLPRVFPLPDLYPQWVRRLSAPDYFFVVVDFLREKAEPGARVANVLTADVYRAVETRMGEETFQSMIRATKGFKTYLGTASRFVKLAWQNNMHEHVLTLLDTGKPFFDEEHNVAYFKHVEARKKATGPTAGWRGEGDSEAAAGWG